MNTTQAVSKDDIPDYAPATIELPDGSTASIDVIPDETMGAPWDEHDGHGIVSEWTRRGKGPGELILAFDRTSGSFRYYDYAASVRIARKDGWGAEGCTARERAAIATMADYNRLRAWCEDRWQWIGVSVTLTKPNGETGLDSCFGIESDGDYWREVAADMLNSLSGRFSDVIAEVIAAEELYA